MGVPYRARVNERTLLNLPGFHGGAYVYVYVEDTQEGTVPGAIGALEPGGTGRVRCLKPTNGFTVINVNLGDFMPH